MELTGDGESQPVEGVDALDDLADALDPVDEGVDSDADPEGEDEDAEPDEQEDDDTEADEDDEDEAEDDPTVVIKHDGKDVTLKLSEVKNLAQQGFDYSHKTMAVAEERKAVAQEREQVTQTRQQYEQALSDSLARMTAVHTFMQAQVGQPPDVSMLQYDTNGYILAEQQHKARAGQLEQATAEIYRLQDEQHRQRHARLESEADSTLKHLQNTLPSWDENAQKQLAGYLAEREITLDTAGDAFVKKGLWELAHKAKAYDAIQAKKAEMKPTKQLAKVAKPSAANPVGKAAIRAKREAAFDKNPSVDALANCL